MAQPRWGESTSHTGHPSFVVTLSFECFNSLAVSPLVFFLDRGHCFTSHKYFWLCGSNIASKYIFSG